MLTLTKTNAIQRSVIEKKKTITEISNTLKYLEKENKALKLFNIFYLYDV